MLANRPEFHICDLAVLMTGATPFSVYQTSPPNQIRYIVADSGCARDDHGAVVPAPDPGGAQGAPRPRDGDRDRRRRPGRRAHAGRPARDRPRLRPRRRRGGRRRRGPADADLHVRHDRAAEGRRDQPPRLLRLLGRPARQRAEPEARLARHLVAAQRARRRAQRAPLPADHVPDDGHLLLRRPRDHGLPRRGAAVVVLLGAADLGEAADARRGAAGRGAHVRARVAGRRDREGAPRAAR